eukprot:1142672-Pelagomonas_calceolata.AAC.13
MHHPKQAQLLSLSGGGPALRPAGGRYFWHAFTHGPSKTGPDLTSEGGRASREASRWVLLLSCFYIGTKTSPALTCEWGEACPEASRRALLLACVYTCSILDRPSTNL